MRLLIVDDSKAMRSILASYAEQLGCETVQAEDGLKALDTLRTDRAFGAALIDWDMPNMSGIELLKAIRADEDYDGIKCMMVTAQNSFDKVSEALSSGAEDYLMKPLDQEMLAEKLRLLGLLS